ncbi:MAG: SUMF1/EgtB/PvdO family nonheme iron enzyme [Burkholderiales bacterium]|nr:SUMF1/EgtB/PvdO family nonheme iron enzyme [Burkholderiales bacterium]
MDDASRLAGVDQPRQLSGSALGAALRDSRARTWALVGDLTPAQWQPPRQPGVNPVAWELAHLAWFAEFWILRGPHGRDADGHALAHRPPRHAGPDAHLDSSRLAHDARWTTPMPSRAQLVPMLAGQLDACIDALPPDADDHALYFHRLALLHEDMHGEALCWLRAALAYPAPAGTTLPVMPASTALAVRGGTVELGVRADARGFAFDNERPGHHVTLPDFEIDSAPVSAGAFARFVDAGGYDTPRYWPAKAGAWRARSGLDHPQRWQRDDRGGWQMRWFDHWVALDHAAPAIHLNAFEAEAYCLWAGRRLPLAAEWEHAAAQRGPAFHWGASVWEWTADAFAPYPGFAPGPYREYSAPWFGNHRELRGGAFATHARLHDRRYRNFFEPHRTDVFAGFRTAAL